MGGIKKVNSDLEILGKAIVSTVPNNTGTVVTYNANSKEISQRTNAEIIADLGLITATNIAAAYYTKAQLQTSGQAQVNWGNLIEVPTTFAPSAHNHDDRYYTETESDGRFVPYTGANKPINFNTQSLTLNGDLIKGANNFEISNLGTDAVSSVHFKRLTDVASLTIGSSSASGDIIITIPIRTSTRWMMEVDIFNNTFSVAEKLIISGYNTSNSSAQVSCLTDTELISEVKFCRDANNNTVLILKRATGTSAFTYGKVNINDFYHGVTYHADLAVKSNYKVEFIDESTLTGITVGPIIKVDKVNFGSKNVDFTSGTISKTQNSIRHFRDVYHGYSVPANTDKILSIKFPPQTAQSTMFRVEIDFYQYATNLANYTGKLIVSFYKQGNTSINVSTGMSFHWIGDKMLPTNIIKVGFDPSGNISINIGDATTDWPSYTSFRVSSLESKFTGFNADYSKGWAHEFISDETGYTSLLTVPLTISANQDWVNTQITNAGHTHANKALLDTINQNLGSGYTVLFNGVSIGKFLGNAYTGFNSALPFAFLNNANAQSIYTKGVLASDSYADGTKIPTNGIYSKGNVLTGGGFAKEGGTASQFLKADGSVDSTVYAPNSSLGNYLPLTGGTISGVLNVTGFSYLNGGIRSSNTSGAFWQVNNGTNNLFIIGSESTITGGATNANVGYYSYGGIHIFHQAVLFKGNITGEALITAPRYISTVPTGTAPLTVASTTVVPNLNTDLLDGKHGSDYIEKSEFNGGRNYLLNSGNFNDLNVIPTTWAPYASVNMPTVVDGKMRVITGPTGSPRLRTFTSFPLETLPQKYIISVEYIGTGISFGGKSSDTLGTFGENGAQSAGTFTHIKTDTFDDNRKKSYYHWTTLAKGTALSSWLWITFPNNSTTDIINVKVEKGSIATDWTPAPEDQVSDWNQTDVTAFDFIKNKPTSLPPTAHTHVISDVTGLQTALDNKEPVFTKNSAFNKNFGTTLGTVAQGNHTHNYSDLIGAPTIPTVNNGTLTLSTGTGLSGSATFGANQGTAATFSVAVASTHKLPTTTEWDGKFNVPTGATTQYVRGDGTLATFPTIPQGTVTSVAMTAPTGLSVTGSPITSSGTLALSYATGYQGYTTTEATKLAGIAAEADKYGSWNLKTNGVQRTTVTSGGTLDLVAGTNVSLSYGAGGVVTINSTDTIYTHPTTSGNKHIPAGGAAGQILRWSADGTAVWGVDNNTTYSVFTTGVAGLVPARVGATTTRFLREDGTWVIPTDTNTIYTNGTGLALSSNQFSLTTTVTTDIAKGVTAHGWGNHATVGYLTGFTESDPTVPTWVKSITQANITSWNGKYTLPTGGNSSQYINGLGNLTTMPNFALTDGTNATGTWTTDSNGLFVNGSVGNKTFNGTTPSSLLDANNGSVAGIINSTSGSPVTGTWYHSLKMLHSNPTGYYTEIAVMMTGNPGMYYKQYQDGNTPGWIQTLDQTHAQEEIVFENDKLSLEVYHEDIDNIGSFTGSAVPYKLIYLKGETGGAFDLYDLLPKQRIILFNYSSFEVDVKNNGSNVGKLAGSTKISLFIDSDYRLIFYDQTELFIGGF